MFRSGYVSVWLSRRREKEILGECKLHADAVVATVNEMRKVVHAFCDENLESTKKGFESVFKQERDADELKREILDKLSRGPFHPITREEVVRVVLTADDVAANAKSAARKISASSSKDLPERIKEGLKHLADMDVEIAEKMREAFVKLVDDPEVAIEVTHEVERMEEEIDEYRVALVEDILGYGDKVKSIATWLMLKEAVENMENIADRSEDVADVIRSIAIQG